MRLDAGRVSAGSIALCHSPGSAGKVQALRASACLGRARCQGCALMMSGDLIQPEGQAQLAAMAESGRINGKQRAPSGEISLLQGPPNLC